MVGMSMGRPDAWIDLRLEEVSGCYRGEPCSTLACVRAWQAERAGDAASWLSGAHSCDESLALFGAATDPPDITGALAEAVRIGSILGDLRTYRREVAELRDRARSSNGCSCSRWPTGRTVWSSSARVASTTP